MSCRDGSLLFLVKESTDTHPNWKEYVLSLKCLTITVTMGLFSTSHEAVFKNNQSVLQHRICAWRLEDLCPQACVRSSKAGSWKEFERATNLCFPCDLKQGCVVFAEYQPFGCQLYVFIMEADLVSFNTVLYLSI